MTGAAASDALDGALTDSGGRVTREALRNAETEEAIDFAAGAWSKGGHLDPPAALTTDVARNKWRMVEGATRWAQAVLDPAAPDRDPTKPVTSEALVTIAARALIIFEERGGYQLDTDAAATLELAQQIVDEATRRLERDAITTYANGNGHMAAARPAPRLRFVSDEELEQQALPESLIEGLMSCGAYVMVVGDPGSLKSFLALDWAYHICAGLPWAGRTVKQGRVAYILAEGRGQFSLRTLAWRQVHADGGRVPGLRFLPQPIQLPDREQVAELLEAMAAEGEDFDAVVIDTRARCTVGLNENDATDQGEAIAGVDRIRAVTGATVIEVHHSPRGEERERGSVALRAATDTLLHCAVDGDFVTVTPRRQKDLDEGEPILLRKRIVELPNGRTSLVLMPVTDAEQCRGPMGINDLHRSHRQVLEAINRGGVKSNKQLAATTELNERAVYRALRALRDRDLIAPRGWSLTAKGARLIDPELGNVRSVTGSDDD